MHGFRLKILPVLLLSVFFDVQFAMAHGTDHRVVEHNKTVAVAFTYSDDSPMSYASVLVFSPENDKIEYQNGRTDQNGYFAFCPDAQGEWRIEAGDGVGHKEQGRIEISTIKPDGKESVQTVKDPDQDYSSDSNTFKAVAGISLICNFCMGLYLWKRKSATFPKN